MAIQNSLNAATKNAMATYLQTQSILKGYENIMLPNATSILRSAEKRLSAGEINFLEWLLLAGQARTLMLSRDEGATFSAADQPPTISRRGSKPNRSA